MRRGHDMPFGASLRPGGGARFGLWAPAARSADLVLPAAAGAPPRTVRGTRAGDGWWSAEDAAARPGTLYQWRIDGELDVPDPASRHNPQGAHGPSAVIDPHAFDWDDGWMGRPWHEVVLYEMHVGAFTQEGTFRAAAQRLPALAALGITAIELMPIADFPGRFGWGYDGVLPFAAHAAYGTPDDLKHFIQAAHRLGLMVFLDVVYNHFGPEGNYLHRYAPQFFSSTHRSPWGAALNFDGAGSAVVRDFFVHNALYWTQEFCIDGLRLDAVHAIVDDGPRHILEDISRAVREAAGGRHIHLVVENEHNGYEWLAREPVAGRYDGQWNDDFHHALHVALTGETHGYYHDYGVQPLDQLARALADGMLYEASPRRPGGAREQVRAAPAQWLPSLVNFAHNHDQVGNRAFGERLSQLVHPQAAPLATLLALLTPAIPLLFFGEESGAAEPFLYFANWDGELREAVREGRKREFGHGEAAHGEPLPDACDVATFEASRPSKPEGGDAERRAWMSMVKSALAARARWITPRQAILRRSGHSAQRVGATGIAVQWRYEDGRELALELNLGAAPVEAPAERLGPVEAELVFEWNRTAAPDGAWPAWSARWTLGTEITL